jgi:two-component system chemotaxis response regulator CheY
MASETILLVDDSNAVRRAVSLMLSGEGYRCLEAEDGRKALDVLHKEDVDLVLTDLHMPELDGFGLIEGMRAEPKYRFTPVLVLTTECREDVVSRLKRAGVTGVIQKPVERDGLRSILKRCLP